MLQIKDICKEYRTNGFVQKALDHVSLNLRDNEFVAILGPSGSGKTTLLNIIGGLDRYDSGDLIIDGISTQKYNDRDWDSYRNHTIGFVFQSYNLIPHQTVLANVELALTISGVSKSERRQRAIQALEEVGLGKQLHKKPNQMSGGQMQRVAIARALVNNPDILLADEPTGALDSATSVQVMDLLQEVAKDRLVVMVSHNPELAKQYATRIVNLRDGKICADSDPFVPAEQKAPTHKNMGRASMSFLTALSLSFNNLKTKKARTLLTAFAGSIGIIGIALILSLSSGVNVYIQNVERDTLSEYPLQIQSTGFDSTALLGGMSEQSDQSPGQVGILEMVTKLFSTMNSNDLKSLKAYLDSGQSGIDNYASAVEYAYDCKPQIYRLDGDGVRQVNPDSSFAALGLGSSMSSSSIMSTMMGTDVFHEMPSEEALYRNQYEVKAGRWPENAMECVLVLTPGGSMSDFMLYTLGLRDATELDTMVQQFVHEENVTTPSHLKSYAYDDILGITFKVVSSPDYYEYDSEYGVWRDKREDAAYMRTLVEQGDDLTIVGVVQPTESGTAIMQFGTAYPTALTHHLAEKASSSKIVQDQLADPHTNVFTNEPFGQKQGANDFSLDSLVDIDEEALRKMFSFDESDLSDSLEGAFSWEDMGQINPSDLDLSKIDLEQIDLSGMIRPEDLQLDLPAFPQMDMASLMQGVQFHVSADSMETLVTGLMDGWKEYTQAHPEADYSGMSEDFLAFLHTDAGCRILKENLQDILQTNGIVAPTQEQVQELLRLVLSDFLAYCQEVHPEMFAPPPEPSTPESGQVETTPAPEAQLQAYLTEYLGTDRAQVIITDWMNRTFPTAKDFEITQDQLEKLVADLTAGYRDYAVANGLPDPSKIGAYFADYMATASAQNILSAGVVSMVDASGLQQQLGTVMESYMKTVGTSLAESLGTSLQTGLASVMEEAMEQVMGQVMLQVAENMQSIMEKAVNSLGDNLAQAFQFDPEDFAQAFSIQMDAEDLSELLQSLRLTQSDTYESNLSSLDYVDFENPSVISIYPRDFESKEQVTEILQAYNDRMKAEGKDEQAITYTDTVGTLMSSVTDIIDVISYVLIAFVAISLVVSSIMIGVITYISVLERKKEIGILRAMGASKRNISQVFNAETFIIGLTSGLIGIGLTLLILIPGNMLIHHLANSQEINAFLPVGGALLLIGLSVLLTLLGGLIPAKKAAKSDPVTALRTE